MANIRLELTTEGKEFIRHMCTAKNQNNRLLQGNASVNVGEKRGLPNTIPPTESTKVWKSNATFDKVPITTGQQLADALITWYNQLAFRHKVDPNIMAAQSYVESQYQLWAYSSTAMGISQFTMETVYTVLINNFGKGLDVVDIENRDIITSGLTNPLDIASYQIGEGNSDIPKQNKPILHQNIMDNPRIMLEAQFKYMRWLADRSKNLASTTLFAYNRGLRFTLPTYSAAIESAKKYKSNNPEYYKEGTDYVLKTFIVLGDKQNKLAFNKRATKEKDYYFGYDYLFKYIDSKNVEHDQFIYKNTNFQVFDANIEESKALGVSTGFEDNIVTRTLSESSNYKFVYFPEEQYIRNSIQKNQIVLHHTVSGGDGTGDINWWKSRGERVATAFIINRDGLILQLFSTDYWAGHIGKFSQLNQRSIGIELVSWGGLTQRDGQWVASNNRNVIPQENVLEYPEGFRDFKGFENYTQPQLKSLEEVLIAIKAGHPEIDFTYKENAFGVYNPSTKQYAITQDALDGVSGIWSHTAYRIDKSDVHPQQELKTLLQQIITKIPIA